jgi:hypothetical protein
MVDEYRRLSDQAVTILGLIAEGRSYDQILSRNPSFTYAHIFESAKEALLICAPLRSAPKITLEQRRERYPRAYEKWTKEEDNSLRLHVGRGETVARIADHLRRNRGAIRSRIVKLGLEGLMSENQEDLGDA